MPAWQRNLIVIWIAELMAIAGFSLVLPFLPYYIQELGVTDPTEVALWTGVLTSSFAITMAIFAPIWGMLSDRFGRKIMVERAIFGAMIFLGLMAFAQNVYQVLVLRILQGAITGTMVAATTLVASSAPRERCGYALGMLQTAAYVGASLGPTFGGLLADAFGYRSVFWITAAVQCAAGLGVHFLVHEEFHPAPPRPGGHTRAALADFRQVLQDPMVVSVLLVRILTRLGQRIVSPVMPLFVQQLLPGVTRIASVAGLIVGGQAGASALGAVVLGRLGDRTGHQRILVICCFLCAVLYVPQFFAQNVTQLLVMQLLVGLAMGGLLTSVSALLAQHSPEGKQGTVYGLDSSAVSTANFVAPLIGASVTAWMGVRVTFLWTAGVLGVSAVLVTWLLARVARVVADRAQRATADAPCCGSGGSLSE